MRVAVHPLKVKIWEGIQSGKIKTGMTLRDIGKIIGVSAPQKVKHHLEIMRTMGTIDRENGMYKLEK